MAPPFDLPRAPWLGVPPPRAGRKLEGASTPHATFTFRRRRAGLFGRRGRATGVFLATVSWVDGGDGPVPLHGDGMGVETGDGSAELQTTLGGESVSAEEVGVSRLDEGVGDAAWRHHGEKEAAATTADGSAEKGVSGDDEGWTVCPPLLSAAVPSVSDPGVLATTAKATATATATASEGTEGEAAASSPTMPTTYTLTRGELVHAAVLLGRRYWLIQEGRRRYLAKLAGEKKHLGESQWATREHVQCLAAHAADVRAALVPMLEGAQVLRAWEAAVEDALNAKPSGQSSSSSSASSRGEHRGAPWTLPPTPAFSTPTPTTPATMLDPRVCSPPLSPAHKAAFAHALALHDAPDLPPMHELPSLLKNQYDGSKGFAWFPPDPSKVVQHEDD